VIYLASPYSHEDPKVVKKRYEMVLAKTAELIREKKFVYSPIVHCHEMAKVHKLPTDFVFWREYNLDMIAIAESLYVYRLAGWQNSVGVIYEIDWATELGKEIVYVD
jgi:hypothetical protein